MALLSSAHARTLRVLLIDDDPGIRRAVPRLLSPRCEVVAVDGCTAALHELAAGREFDAALVDLQMPVINGRDSLELLLKVAPVLARRAIILTSGAFDPVLQGWADGLEEGALIRKPPKRDTLIAAIEARIARFPSAPPPAETTTGKRRKT